MKNNSWSRLGIIMSLISLHSSLLYAAEQAAVLHWSKRVELSLPVSGVVEQVLVKPGDRVDKGGILVRLDIRVKEAQLEQAKADLTRQIRLRDEAKKEMMRAEELYERTVLSDHELELAYIDFARAEASYATAKTELTRSKVDLYYSEFKAPFDGIVIDSFVEVGQSILNNVVVKPLFVFAESKHMLARAYVSQKLLSNIEKGKGLAVHVAGKKFLGSVERIGLEPVKDQSNGKLYQLDVKFKLGNQQFMSGQAASISIP